MSDEVVNDVVDSGEESVSEEVIENGEAGGEESVEVQAESKEDLQQEIEEAIDAGASEEQIRDMIKVFQLKVNGKTINKKVDLSDEESLKREFQLAEANKNGMQRARELEKLYEQEIRRLKQDPWSVLRDLQLDPDELNERYMSQRIEEMKKSPEQIEREKMQRELEDARRELEARKKEAESARFEALREQEAHKLEEEIQEALSANTKIPKTQKTIMRIADAMYWAIENAEKYGWDASNISVKDVLPAVEAELRSEMRGFLDEMPEELMEEYIGKQNIERLRKKRLAAARTKTSASVPETTAQVRASEPSEPKKKVRMKDFFNSVK